MRTITFQAAGMTKPLASAGRVTSVLDDDFNILHEDAGMNIKLQKKGSAMVMRMNLVVRGAGGRSQDDKRECIRVLGVLGFTWQED